MDDNAVRLLALQQASSISADLEAEFLVSKGTRPVFAMLCIAKRDAAEAMLELVKADEIEIIRIMQGKVRRFGELIEWLQEIKVTGDEAEKQISEDDREMLLEALSQEGDEGKRELQALGLMQGDDE